MKFTFDNKAKAALEELVNNSGENYVRIKVFYGCGRPAYELYMDFKKEDDIEVEAEGIKFVVNKGEERACTALEIKYDEEVYNKGFYVKDIG